MSIKKCYLKFIAYLKVSSFFCKEFNPFLNYLKLLTVYAAL